MVDFNTATITYKDTRKYAEITDFNDFIGLKETFRADMTMGLLEKKVSGESYKGVVNIIHPDGFVAGTVTVESKYAGFYPDIIGGINTDFAERNLDDGYTAVEDTDKRNWKMTLGGETAAGDPFSLQVGISKAVLTGYHLAATKQTIETWSDAQTELSGEPTA